MEKELSTEEKIKEAARKLFTHKGFAATRTRDIAQEAGINLALLNYYFRNKQKLFDIIMWENLELFLSVLLQNLEGEHRSLQELLGFMAENYIDMLLKNPDLPFFVLSMLQSGEAMEDRREGIFFDQVASVRDTFISRLGEQIQQGHLKNVHPMQFLANLMGMIIFPFIASRLLKNRFHLGDEAFRALMEERKKLIPQWMMMTLQ
jgi:AcrR family transcriptional regulator